MLKIDEKYKKYLPSKKFTYFIFSFIGIGILIFLVSTLIFGKNSFSKSKKEKDLITQNLTMNQLLQKDSDGDGVFDWEEGLWGTDPKNTRTFENMPDAEYIKSKRELLQTPGASGLDSNNLTETDKFAQQFFASLAALKQSGELDENSIKNMSYALGEAMADPKIIDFYTLENIKTSFDSSAEKQADYYIESEKIFSKYKTKGIGTELELVSTLVSSGSNTSNENKLNTISKAYQDFAKEMLSVSAPEIFSSYHLKIINSANNTGISINNMLKIAKDPILGLSGVSQYQNYSELLIKSVQELETILTINGIIEE